MNINRILVYLIVCLGVSSLLAKCTYNNIDHVGILSLAWFFSMAFATGYVLGTFQVIRDFNKQFEKLSKEFQDLLNKQDKP